MSPLGAKARCLLRVDGNRGRQAVRIRIGVAAVDSESFDGRPQEKGFHTLLTQDDRDRDNVQPRGEFSVGGKSG